MIFSCQPHFSQSHPSDIHQSHFSPGLVSDIVPLPVLVCPQLSHIAYTMVVYTYDRHRKHRTIKATRVRPERRLVARHREGGRARNLSSARKAETMLFARSPRSSSTKTSLQQQAAKISNRAVATKEPSREMPAGRVFARRSLC